MSSSSQLPGSPLEPPRPPQSAPRAPGAVRNWLIIGAVLIGGLLYVAKLRRDQIAGGAAGATSVLEAPHIEGRAAPNFTLPDPQGRMVSLAQFKGHPVVVDFWATWCDPCNIEIPWWKDLQDKYRSQGLVILGVSEDDSPADVVKFLARKPLNYTVLMDMNRLESTYGNAEGLPTTLYINRQGQIVNRVAGLEGEGDLEAHIKGIL